MSGSQSNSASDSSANYNVVSAFSSVGNNNQPRELPVITGEYGFESKRILCRNWPHDSVRPQNNNRGGDVVTTQTQCLWEQGWCSGESTRLPPMWPGFDSRHHMWVEFVGSRPCSEGFSPGSPVFLPPQKQTIQIPIRSGIPGPQGDY